MDDSEIPGLPEALMHAASLGVVVVDSHGTCQWSNHAAQRILGRAEALRGETWNALVPGAGSSGRALVLHGQRELDLEVSSLGSSGSLMTFRDVTSERQAARRLTAMQKGIGLVPYSGSLERTLDTIAHEVVEASGASACQIITVGSADGAPWVAAHAGMPDLPADYAERLAECGRRGATLHASLAMERQVPIIEHHQRERLLKGDEWEPLRDYLGDLDWDTFVTVPLVHRDQIMGALNGFYPYGIQPTHDDVSFFIALSDQVAVALRIAQLSAQLQGETSQLERERIGSDLHDSVCQSLYSLSLHMGAAELALRAGTTDGVERAQRELGMCRQLADDTLAEMRALIFESRASAVADIGLLAAIRRLANALHIRSAVDVKLDLPREVTEPSPTVSEHVYRVIQEATTNAAKHGNAQEVAVSIEMDPERRLLIATIEDDGEGFTPAASTDGFGLQMMMERARKIGAEFSIEPSRYGGTVVRLAVGVE